MQTVWVEGEISNARVWNTGHMYFTLKDSASQIKAVMFRSAVSYLKFKPVDGLKVVARGKVSVYDPKGEYQIICEHLEPKGLGSLQLAFEQLKKKLQAEGLFDQARKRPLPALPRRIGIVTSMDGAALRDIVRVLRRRYPNAHLVLSPTRVQGEGAGREVAHAIRKVTRIEGVDVVILARGGGSLEDLWAFNEEVLARVIADSPVPIISGVGHETDFTIADFVADLRAPTPSAAAELVVKKKDEFFGAIDRICERLDAAIHHRLRRMETRLHVLEARPGYAGYRRPDGRARPPCVGAGERLAPAHGPVAGAALAPARSAAPIARSIRSASSPRRGPHPPGLERRAAASGGATPPLGGPGPVRRARGADRGAQPARRAGPRLLRYLGRVANAYYS